MSRSRGPGSTWTLTVARLGAVRRSVGSKNPIVTLPATGASAPATEIVSVTASVAALTELAGPVTSTDFGSTVMVPMTNPGAGSPSTSTTTGTSRVAAGSSSMAIVAGTT